jgi:uncharacterized membrane protein (DUF485 family)
MVSSEQKKGIRRTAIVMTLIALTFYVGFIMMGVMQS